MLDITNHKGNANQNHSENTSHPSGWLLPKVRKGWRKEGRRRKERERKEGGRKKEGGGKREGERKRERKRERKQQVLARMWRNRNLCALLVDKYEMCSCCEKGHEKIKTELLYDSLIVFLDMLPQK